MQSLINGAIRTTNALGRLGLRLGLRTASLEKKRLIAAAAARTGLRNFGDFDFDARLTRLLESYAREAELTLVGRIAAREHLVELLSNLLLMADAERRNPAIRRQAIQAPLFVIGLPRTGSTLLHGLLAQDPANRVPLSWEVMFPTRPGDRPASHYIGQCDALLRWADRLAPGFKRIHPLAAELPQECIAITAHTFMSIEFHTTHKLTGYQDWLEATDQTPAYAFHKRFLQHLQSHRASQRWVLKAPGHLFGLDALLGCYPDALIVQTHRDPLDVVASLASHATVLRHAFSDRVDDHQVAADWVVRWGRAINESLRTRVQYPGERFFDLHYADLLRDPIAAVRTIYTRLGFELSTDAEHAMSRFLELNPKDKHGTHRYSLDEFGLDPGTERERFRSYCEQFGIGLQEDHQTRIK